VELSHKSFVTEEEFSQAANRWARQVQRNNGIKNCAISSNGGKSLHEFYLLYEGLLRLLPV